MNSSTYRFVLDLHSTQSQISLPVLIGDTGRTLRISLSDGSNPYIIEDGCLAKLSIKRPTGTRLEEFCTIENNTTIVYPFSKNKNTCSVEGIHNCDVVLYDLDGEIIGSPRFTMVVSERAVPVDDITLTDEDFTAVDAMIAEEIKRQAEETKRVSAETARVSAEAKRVSAEENRESQEYYRKTAENARSQRENERIQAENARISAEENRVSAENERISAEEARATEEANRVSAEVERANQFKKWNGRIDMNEKRITNLEQGLMADSFETDDSVAYIKDVPTNALPYAAISKIGGMTRREGNVLRSAPVTEVKSVGANQAAFTNGSYNLEDRINLTINNGHWEVSTAVYEDFRYDKWKPYTTLFLKAGTYNFSIQNRRISHNENVAFTVMILDLKTGDDIAELLFRLNQSDNTDFVIDKDKEVYIAAYVFNSTGQTASCSFDMMISKGSGRKDFTEPTVHTLPTPAEVQALDGYGDGVNADYYNYIDYEKKQFVKRVAKVVFNGTENWERYTASDSIRGVGYCYSINTPNKRDYSLSNCSQFNRVYKAWDYGTIGDYGDGTTDGKMYFVTSETTVEEWKSRLASNPITLVYELAEPIVSDISDLLDKDNLIGVEGGGDITMVNEHEYAVPSEIIYQMKGV